MIAASFPSISQHLWGRLSALVVLILMMASPLRAELAFTPMPTQYIAALGDRGATSGTGAEAWGLWAVDPGPRGVKLNRFAALQAAGGIAPANWAFDGADWWLEEHGLIMEPPTFPLPPGRYVVTGGRAATAILTVQPMDNKGTQSWSLDQGATLYDVTHLRCRAARYTPSTGAGPSCSPQSAQQAAFPVAPGAAMPAVGDCNKQDYEVLIVIGKIADS